MSTFNGYFVAASDSAWIVSDTTCADIGVANDAAGASPTEVTA